MTKFQLEARVQALSACLASFDMAHFQRVGWRFAQQWALDYRESLYDRLVAARKALAEAPDEPSPYAPSEAYLNALRSFGLTDEQCVEELRSARDSDFELHLAEEVRKAYDEGWKDGKIIGFANGFNKNYDIYTNNHDLVLNTGRTMRGSDEYNTAMSRATNYSPDKI